MIYLKITITNVIVLITKGLDWLCLLTNQYTTVYLCLSMVSLIVKPTDQNLRKLKMVKNKTSREALLKPREWKHMLMLSYSGKEKMIDDIHREMYFHHQTTLFMKPTSFPSKTQSSIYTNLVKRFLVQNHLKLWFINSFLIGCFNHTAHLNTVFRQTKMLRALILLNCCFTLVLLWTHFQPCPIIFVSLGIFINLLFFSIFICSIHTVNSLNTNRGTCFR